MTITYSVAGVALDDSAGRWRLMSETTIGGGISLRTSDLQIPGMDGTIAPAYEPVDAPLLVLDVRVDGTSYATMMRNYRAILAVLSPTGSVTVTKTVDSMVTSALARGKSTSDPTFNPSLFRLQFKATLRLTGAYWRGNAGDWSQSNPTSGTAYEVTTLADSTAPINDGLFLLTGPMDSGAQVKCAGGWYKLGTALAAGDKALVDSAGWTVRIGSGVDFTGGGTLTTGVLTNSGGPFVLPLVPKIQAGDPTDTAIKVTLVATGMTSSSAIAVRAQTAHIA